MMKRRFSIIVFAAIFTSLLALSCKKENEGQEVPTVKLSVNELSVEFKSEGGEKTVDFTAAAKPNLVKNADWIEASASFSGTSGKITIKATACKSTTERSATLSVICGSEKQVVNIRQEAYVESVPEPDEPVNNETAAWARSLGLGWNLGNQLDAHINGVSSETCWGNRPATQATMDGVKKAGFGTVRIPVTWMGHIGEAPDYTIEKEWLDRVAEVVGYAEKARLKAIVNIHHDGADSNYWLDIKNAANNSAKQTEILAEITAVWSQIAERLDGYGDFLMFEAFNEIHDGGWGWGDNRNDGGRQYRTLEQWNQAFVDAVRATGGNNATRMLSVPGYCADPEMTMDNLNLPQDKAEGKIAVAVHFYAPIDFTLNGKYTEWGHTGTSANKAPGNMDEDYLKGIFSRLNAKYVANGIPCYIGEFGCANRSGDRAKDFQQYYLEYVCKAANTYGLAPVLWDNGSTGEGKECDGYIDHGTGEIINGTGRFISAMVKGATSTDSKYTLESVYNNAPR